MGSEADKKDERLQGMVCPHQNSHWDLVSIVALVKGRACRRDSCISEET